MPCASLTSTLKSSWKPALGGEPQVSSHPRSGDLPSSFTLLLEWDEKEDTGEKTSKGSERCDELNECASDRTSDTTLVVVWKGGVFADRL